MVAVKKNEEVKILDMQKNEYLEKGYTIYDDKMKIVAKPAGKEDAKIKQLEKQVADLTKTKADLESDKAGLEKQVADLTKTKADLESDKAGLEKQVADLQEDIKKLKEGKKE